MLSACRCTFKRQEKDAPEKGIAITRAFGLSDVVVIVPDDASMPVDVLMEVWNYHLDWTHSIDGCALWAQYQRNSEVSI